MNDEAKNPHTSPTRAAVVETPEVLEAREREMFRRLVLHEAKLIAEQARYEHLMRDRRNLKSQLASVEAEIKEIESRRPRHVLKSS